MSVMKELLSSSYLFGSNAPFIEELYEAYLDDPQSVPGEWREYFDKLQLAPAGEGNGGRDVAHAPIIESFAQRARAGAARPVAAVPRLDRKQVSVIQLVAEYRVRGVFLADIDPLKRRERPRIAELDPAYYDLTDADMDTVFNTGSLISRPCWCSPARSNAVTWCSRAPRSAGYAPCWTKTAIRFPRPGPRSR